MAKKPKKKMCKNKEHGEISVLSEQFGEHFEELCFFLRKTRAKKLKWKMKMDQMEKEIQTSQQLFAWI